MNIKRGLIFGVMLWIFIFTAISILMFIPGLKGNDLYINIAFWIVLIPIVLLLCKWYFKGDAPSIKKGFYLGLLALAIGTVLDMMITVPLFVGSYKEFYSDWQMYIGFVELIALTTFAGFEFDATYSKREQI